MKIQPQIADAIQFHIKDFRYYIFPKVQFFILLYSVTDQMEKDIRCNLCDKICGSESFLNSHIKAKHESLMNRMNYECDK